MKHLFLLLFPALIVIASAQETPKVHVRTICFERDASGLNELVVMAPEAKIVPISFPESFPSERAQVPISKGKIYFYDPKGTGDKPIPAAVASLPSGMKDALVLFFPSNAPEGEPVYRTVVIDGSKNGIPEDGAMVMNVFPEPIRVVIGEHRVQFKPGMKAAVKRPTKRNDYNMAPVVFQSKSGVDGDWKTVAETMVRFPPEQRHLFVSFADS